MPFRFQAIHVTILASLIAHGVALLELGQHWSSGRQSEAVPNLTLQARLAPPARPEPPPRTAPAPKPRPRPVRRTAERPPPPPKPRPAVRPPPPPPQAQAAAKTVEKTPPPATPAAAPPSPAGLVSVVQMQQDYTRTILQRIERHKHYPPAARRRRISGKVTLSLTLDHAGRIRELRCRDGNRLLCRAAERAARQAAPFPPLPQGTQTLTFDYRMRFSLR